MGVRISTLRPMRTFITAVACSLIALVAWPGEQPALQMKLPEPREHVARPAEKAVTGGVVYARIDATGTQIEAIRDLGDRPQAIESIYFPVFAPRGSSAADVLERSKFYAHLGAVQLDDITVAKAPANAPRPPPGVQIMWFQFLLKDLDPGTTAEGGPIVFKVSYWQPHVGGHFYYLPQNLPEEKAGGGVRAWHHPMIVRSLTRLINPPKGDVDSERMADLLIVFPKDATLVAIPVPKMAGPNLRPGPVTSPAKGETRRP